jgi:hypothetical protein
VLYDALQMGRTGAVLPSANFLLELFAWLLRSLLTQLSTGLHVCQPASRIKKTEASSMMISLNAGHVAVSPLISPQGFTSGQKKKATQVKG